MFSHKQVWAAIDSLAQQYDMSVSRLARNAGLDPTTFNKSKRMSVDGRLRWPSTESLSKIMLATGSNIDDFALLISRTNGGYGGRLSHLSQLGFAEEITYSKPNIAAIPLMGMAKAGNGGFFDDSGVPSGDGWDAVNFPNRESENIYALEIQGDSMMPLYRDGDRIIVSPTSSVRRGDRVVVRTREGEVMAKILARQTAKFLELESLNPEHKKRTIDVIDLDWIARIIWASQ